MYFLLISCFLCSGLAGLSARLKPLLCLYLGILQPRDVLLRGHIPCGHELLRAVLCALSLCGRRRGARVREAQVVARLGHVVHELAHVGSGNFRCRLALDLLGDGACRLLGFLAEERHLLWTSQIVVLFQAGFYPARAGSPTTTTTITTYQKKFWMATRTFPSEVFARLAPDIYFERSIAQNERPNGRKFDEPRDVKVIPGDGSLRGAVGSAVVRAGSATVVCGITMGLTRFIGEGGVYANVEINRGGQLGKPTLEEQVTTMELHRLVEASAIPRSDFVLSDECELCLSAKIIVLSRTGPVLDLCWQALYAALANTKIPEFFTDERTLELVPSTEVFRPLQLSSSMPVAHTTCGVVHTPKGEVLLTDLDGAVEEECVRDRLSYAMSEHTGQFAAFHLSAPNGCSFETIAKALH